MERESVAWRELLLGAWCLVPGHTGGGKSSLAYSDPCLAVVAIVASGYTGYSGYTATQRDPQTGALLLGRKSGRPVPGCLDPAGAGAGAGARVKN